MARAARALNALLAQLDGEFPARSRASDGWIGDAAHSVRDSDHNPDQNGIVHARDYTHDPAHGVDIGRLSDELAASHDNRIKYIIANGWILDSRPGNRPWQWVRYTGENPHVKHLHLSVIPGVGDDPRLWQLPMLLPPTLYDSENGEPVSEIRIELDHEGKFRVPVMAESGGNSRVVGQAWITYGTTWGATSFTLTALDAGGHVMGPQRSHELANNRSDVFTLPPGTRMVTVEGQARAGAVPAAALVVLAK